MRGILETIYSGQRRSPGVAGPSPQGEKEL
jgi:hypothetical protein